MNFKFNEIRVLETAFNNGAWNMALDEVLLNSVNDVPVLRLYGWKPAAVSIGYFQSMKEEVDVEKCKSMDIDVVRRITGGGAVLHDSELTYSFITRKYPQNIMESYQLICDAVIVCLNKLGFDAEFVPLNDIVIDGRKVSGNAQTRKNGSLLQHGTILLDVDAEKMFTVLNVPSEKMRDKLVNDVRERVMGLKRPFNEVAKTLKEAFCEKFDSQPIIDKLTKDEDYNVRKLVKLKYATHEWNWKR